MSRLLDHEQDELPQRERELTLSTGAILAIFLGLVLLCAVFFGFGYNLGRKSTTTTAALPAETSETQPASTTGATFDNFKTSPGSRPAATSPKSTPAMAAEDVPPAIKDREPEAPNAHPAPPTPPATHAAASPASSAAVPTHAAVPALPAPSPGGSFIVQIAAISATHKDDADLLAGALRGRGYTPAERTDAQDKLIHVQVGPYATKADAEAMRERLIVDGYNPIIK